jgi:hypothetical protein
VHIGTPEVHPGRTHSVPQYSVPHRSVPLLDAQVENEREPNPKSQAKDAPKEKEHGTDVRALPKIGIYSRFDPANPKDRAILCVVPWMRQVQPPSDVLPHPPRQRSEAVP